MTLNQLFEQLKALQFEHGDKEIFIEIPTHDYWKSRVLAEPSTVMEANAVHDAYHNSLKVCDESDEDLEDPYNVIVITL